MIDLQKDKFSFQFRSDSLRELGHGMESDPILWRRCRGRRSETLPASGFVYFGAADHFGVGDEGRFAVSIIRLGAAHAACRPSDEDIVRDGDHFIHWAERFTAAIKVESGDDDAPAAGAEGFANGGEVGVEELALIDADHGDAVASREQIGGMADRLGGQTDPVVRDDVAVGVSPIDLMLESEKWFCVSSGAGQPLNEVVGLAAKHAPGDDFDSARSVGGRIANVPDHGGHYTADCQNGISRYAAAREPL
jgi:hypothetical protein